MVTTIIIAMATATNTERGVLKLLAWLSPSFPIGAFSYSHGVEWAVEAGDIADRASLEAWLTDVLRHGAGRTDMALLAHAHRAACARDIEALRQVADLAAAFQPTRERAMESLNQGRAFWETARAAWPAPDMDTVGTVLAGPLALPVAVGSVAALHGIDEAVTAEAALHAMTANLISAAVRLVPLGQTDGQRALAALEDVVVVIAREGRAMSLDDLGGAAFRSDLASMRHETQYTRLFRS